MSGRLLRSACTAALATVTVLAAVPFASYAAAEPGDDTVPGASTTAAPTTAVSTPAASTPGASTPGASAPGASTPGAAAPTASPPATISGMLTELQRLYREAEEATEAYNATKTELTRQRAEVKKLSTGLTQARTALARSHDDVGRLAREQYQGQSELSGYLRLLLARDPQHALDEGYLLEHAARGRAATMSRLTGGEKRADALAAASREALDAQQKLAVKQQRQRDMVRSRLQEVEKLLASLSSAQIAAVAALEKAGTAEAQRKLVSSGALGEQAPTGAQNSGQAGPQAGPQAGARSDAQPGTRRTPSQDGDEALDFAVDQLGKPYEWGAEGPDSFDCSGLTSQAWARAGLTIPRTSQEQWSELPRVSLRELRPGDLVVYFPKATHVAIYLGDGMVIQAPRPGTRVKVSPIAANPLLGAVRPDPGAASLAPAAYEPPELPPGAMDGSDTGYGRTSGPSES